MHTTAAKRYQMKSIERSVWEFPSAGQEIPSHLVAKACRRRHERMRTHRPSELIPKFHSETKLYRRGAIVRVRTTLDSRSCLPATWNW